MSAFIDLSYIVASILFIFGLKMLSSADTARRGNMVSALGMLIAIVATMMNPEMTSFHWIFIGLLAGGLIGAVAAKTVKMTSMPEMVALFNGFGGIASLLVGWAEFHAHPQSDAFTLVAIALAVLIGGITFSGSLIAYAKLAEKMNSKPLLFGGQQVVNAGLLVAAVVLVLVFANAGNAYPAIILLILLALVLGVLAVIPIGGADMPVVIALLNSYSGLAACAAGFVILNNVLIVAGALVGASGLILTSIMCKAMNRSLANVLFSGFGAASSSSAGGGYQGEANPVSVDDAYYILEAARSVIFVPGYGMAVSQAQHVVRELGDLLEANGAEVKYAIHPVAGRMPGHMNVLLAEANVPYEQLVVPEDVNPIMSTVDVAIVIGANDVVNPAAREDENSPLWGMPIINVDQARTCIVSKRSLNPGFAGVDNPLFFKENTRMLFGDAKKSFQGLVAAFKE
jgi:H+-translocating NAD(P) transhydrogenase subunit beta